MYDPIAVANFFLDLGESHSTKIDPLKLQKLLFVAHGWHLAIYRKPLVREPIGAWKWGPVIESVYHEFKRFGGSPITEKGTRPHKIQRDQVVYYEPTLSDLDESLKVFLKKIWDGYGYYSGVQLANITHKPGSPWTRSIEEGWQPIPTHEIRKYYLGLLKKLTSNASEAAEQSI